MKRLLCWLWDNREVIQLIMWVFIAIYLVVLEAWLWFDAPCQVIKDWWVIAKVPGRCL